MNNSSSPAHIVRVNINPAGGAPKHAVAQAEVTIQGVSGDKQRDLRYHGGPERAVSLYSYELLLALQAEGHPVDCGTMGENLTISGLDWATLQPGDQLEIGERLCIEITSYATPCKNIAGSFQDEAFKRVSQKLHPGWSRLYARVLIEGAVREGDAVERSSAIIDC